MLHLMKYRFFSIVRDKTIMFWSFAFPLVLCTLFYVSFGHIGTEIEQIPTALVILDSGIPSKALQTALKEIAEGAPDMLSVKEMEEKEAIKLLESGEIKGIFYASDEPELKVADSGISESVLQQILQEYTDQAAIIASVAQEAPEKLQEALSGMMNRSHSYVKEVFLGGKKVNNMVQYFFALISMTCMFAGYMGVETAEQLQADVSTLGARRCCGSISKIKSILADSSVICLMSFVAVGILLLYISRGLHIYIGDQWGKLLFISFMGSLIGIAFGVLVGSLHKIGSNAKIGIMTAFSLASSALSGLMVSGIKGLVEESCPIINRINPSSVITDAFYSVSIYPDNTRFIRDMATLLALTGICMAAAFLQVRKTCYNSTK